MRMKLWLLVYLLLLFGVACQSQEQDIVERPTEPPRGREINLGEPFGLSAGEEVMVVGENLRLTFDEVLEDSRCPTEVDCFWAGQARISILVQQGDDPPQVVEFNTNPAPDQLRDAIEILDYTIVLQSLDPNPQHPDPPIQFEDYQATLVVNKK